MIHVSIPDLQKVATHLTGTVLKQIPYAAAQALNDTAKDFQVVERQHVDRTMTVRQRTFILNTVKIERGDFATKDKLAVTVQIDPTRNQLAKFEEGGEKHSIQGKHYVAILLPDIRRTKRGLVPRRFYPSAFKPFVDAGTHVKGEQRSFIVPTKSGNRLLLQRYGGKRGRHGVRALYLFVPSVHIDAVLDFLDNAKAVATSAWPANFNRRFLAALRTAK